MLVSDPCPWRLRFDPVHRDDATVFKHALCTRGFGSAGLLDGGIAYAIVFREELDEPG